MVVDVVVAAIVVLVVEVVVEVVVVAGVVVAGAVTGGAVVVVVVVEMIGVNVASGADSPAHPATRVPANSTDSHTTIVLMRAVWHALIE